MRCMRYCFFSYFSPSKPRIPRNLEERGRLAEKRALLWLKNEGMDVKRAGNREIYVSVNGVEYTLVGRADYLSRNAVIEVKAGKPRIRYILAYLAQLNLYMLMYGLNEGMLIFGDGTALEVERSDFVIRQSLTFFSRLAECIECLEIPDGTHLFCANCPYRG